MSFLLFRHCLVVRNAQRFLRKVFHFSEVHAASLVRKPRGTKVHFHSGFHASSPKQSKLWKGIFSRGLAGTAFLAKNAKNVENTA
jgi:hypothetical protein